MPSSKNIQSRFIRQDVNERAAEKVHWSGLAGEELYSFSLAAQDCLLMAVALVTFPVAALARFRAVALAVTDLGMCPFPRFGDVQVSAFIGDIQEPGEIECCARKRVRVQRLSCIAVN